MFGRNEFIVDFLKLNLQFFEKILPMGEIHRTKRDETFRPWFDGSRRDILISEKNIPLPDNTIVICLDGTICFGKLNSDIIEGRTSLFSGILHQSKIIWCKQNRGYRPTDIHDLDVLAILQERAPIAKGNAVSQLSFSIMGNKRR